MPEGSSGRQTVLVTRPREQAAELIELITSRGQDAVPFPVIEIVARERAEIAGDVARSGDADLTIYISTNAVRYGLPYATGRIAAIGPSTAAALEAAGQPVDIVPQNGFDSEHLLAEPELRSMSGRRVRIVRGNGGRETLGSTLRERGAVVDYLEVYARRIPAYPGDELEALEARWLSGEIDCVVVMSVQSLENLEHLLPAACRRALPRTVLVTPAARVLKEVNSGCPECPVVLADGPGTVEIADAIQSAVNSRPSGH